MEGIPGDDRESGDPEKMAMFKLQKVKLDLGFLVVLLDALENWDKEEKEKNFLVRDKTFIKEWKKEWEEDRNKKIAELQPILSELGLAVPQTAEEARTLKNRVVSSDNLQKLAIKYKKESGELK